MAHHKKEVPDSPRDICPLLIGSQIPELTLTGADGSPVDLRTAVSERPSVLIFYRGGW